MDQLSSEWWSLMDPSMQAEQTRGASERVGHKKRASAHAGWLGALAHLRLRFFPFLFSLSFSFSFFSFIFSGLFYFFFIFIYTNIIHRYRAPPHI
jgi:hypothetical protein